MILHRIESSQRRRGYLLLKALIMMLMFTALTEPVAAQTCSISTAETGVKRCLVQCCRTETCVCTTEMPHRVVTDPSTGFTTNITDATVCSYNECYMQAIKNANCVSSPVFNSPYHETQAKQLECEKVKGRLGCSNAVAFARYHQCLNERSFQCSLVSSCTSVCYAEAMKCLVDAPCLPAGIKSAVELCKVSLYEDAKTCYNCHLDPTNDTQAAVCDGHFDQCSSATQLLGADYDIFAGGNTSAATPSPQGDGSNSNGDENVIYVLVGVIGGALIILGLVFLLIMYLRVQERKNSNNASAVASSRGANDVEDDDYESDEDGAGGKYRKNSTSYKKPKRKRKAAHQYQHNGDVQLDDYDENPEDLGGDGQQYNPRHLPPSGSSRKAWGSVREGDSGNASPHNTNGTTSIHVADQNKTAPVPAPGDGAAVVVADLDSPVEEVGCVINNSRRPSRRPNITIEAPTSPMDNERPIVTVITPQPDENNNGMLSPSNNTRAAVPRRGHARTTSQNSTGFNASLNDLDLNFSIASDTSTMPAGSPYVAGGVVPAATTNRQYFSSDKIHQQHQRNQQQKIRRKERRSSQDTTHTLTTARRGSGTYSRGSFDSGEDSSCSDEESTSSSDYDDGSHVPEAPIVRSLTATPTHMMSKDIIRHIKMNAYRRGKRIGKGADGTVTEVAFPNGFTVAVKEVPMNGRNSHEIREYAMGFKTYLKLDHPNVCRLYTITFDAETKCLQFWMEALRGGSLDRIAQKRAASAARAAAKPVDTTAVDFSAAMAAATGISPEEYAKQQQEKNASQPPPGVLPEPQVAEWAAQVLDGLSYLKEHGIIHRDIKGSNILLSTDRSLAKIADFGSALIISGTAPPEMLFTMPGATSAVEDTTLGSAGAGSSNVQTMSSSQFGGVGSSSVFHSATHTDNSSGLLSNTSKPQPDASSGEFTRQKSAGGVVAQSSSSLLLSPGPVASHGASPSSPGRFPSTTSNNNAPQTPTAQLQEQDFAAAGTPLWMAPEIISSKTEPPTFANDVWSFGVTVAELLNKGLPPWPSSSFSNPWSAMLTIASTGAKPSMPESSSTQVQEFLTQCWVSKPEDRVTVEALRNHPWIVKHAGHVPKRKGKPIAVSGGSGGGQSGAPAQSPSVPPTGTGFSATQVNQNATVGGGSPGASVSRRNSGLSTVRVEDSPSSTTIGLHTPSASGQNTSRSFEPTEGVGVGGAVAQQSVPPPIRQPNFSNTDSRHGSKDDMMEVEEM